MAGRVARYQADRTNQKMYFCRIYCQQAEQTPKGQLQEAHIESALMHLYGGYLAFLQEVARNYNLTMPQNLGNESDESNKNGKLPVIDVMASPSSTNISVDMIRQWRGDLVDTIDSLREGMIEF